MTARRAVCYAGLLLLTGAAAWLFGGHTAYFLFGASLVLTGYAALAAFLMRGRIDMELRIPDHLVYAGEDLELELIIRLPFAFPFVWLVAEERWMRSGAPAKVGRALLIPAGRREVRCRYRLTGLARGVYRHGGSRVVVGDLFFAAVRTVPLASSRAAERPVTVLPRPLRGNWYAGAAAGADPAGFGEVRDYRPGDPLRRIDWKSYARHRKWRTKEPDADETGAPFILLDDAEGDSRRFERIIAAAARIVLAEPERAGGLQLRCGDRALRAPAAGRHAALTWLAALDKAQGVPLSTVLGETLVRAEPGRTVIAITASPDPRLLTLAERLGRVRRAPLELVYVAPGTALTPKEGKRVGLFAAAGWRVTVVPGEAGLAPEQAEGGWNGTGSAYG